MNRDLTTPQVEQNPGHEVLRAARLVKVVQEEVEKATNSLDLINTKDEKDVEALLMIGNFLINDLQKATYKLNKIVIRSFREGQTNGDLNVAVQNFSKLTRNLRHDSDEKPEEVIERLKLTLRDLVPEVGELLKSVKSDGEQDKGDTVDVIVALACAAERITLRNTLHNISYEELKKHVDVFENQFQSSLDNLTVDTPYVRRNLIHKIRFGINMLIKMGDYLNEVLSQIDNENVQNCLLKISNNVSDSVAVLDKSLRTSQKLNDIIDNTNVCNRAMCTAINDAIQLSSEYLKDDFTLHNIVLTFVTYILSVGYTLSRAFGLINEIYSEK